MTVFFVLLGLAVFAAIALGAWLVRFLPGDDSGGLSERDASAHARPLGNVDLMRSGRL